MYQIRLNGALMTSITKLKLNIKVTGIRSMAPVLNTGPLEDIWARNVKFLGKERNY